MNDSHPFRTLLALENHCSLDGWLKLAANLTPYGGEIHLRGMVVMPPETSLSEGALEAREWRKLLDPASAQHPFVHDTVKVHVDYQPLRRVLEELPDLHIDLLIVQWSGLGALSGGVSTDEVLRHARCDVVLVSGTSWQNEGPVLLSLRGGPNISIGVRVAKALAGDAPITLFHAADDRRATPELEPLMRTYPQIERAVTAVTDISEGILREVVGHKAIVLGATFHQREGASSAASQFIGKIQEQTGMPLALVRAWRPEPFAFHVPRPQRAEEDLSTTVDRWFAENTFHSHEFADLRTLLDLKEKQGLTISIGLPALNEEATVGAVINTLKTSLMDNLPLVDEIVLIDSDSSDDTVKIAQSYGIPTYKHPEILPEMGTLRGKGEALWKSLYVLKGDIIAWVDTDITNIHPRFIYGLVGPLLKFPQIQYVKGFYQRPIAVDGKMQAYGGGRVTELVARPLLNLFYPELSGIIQPLSGEYAGRRAILEQVPFFSGYAVETGLLIDILERCGLSAIAQIDLEVRVHHNQPLTGLSKMSFAILQAFIARLESRYGAELFDKINPSMKLIIQEPDRFALEMEAIGDVERPAMITLPTYRERHGQ
jgi:glucosyl-3-phosphoglycerate synthase